MLEKINSKDIKKEEERGWRWKDCLCWKDCMVRKSREEMQKVKRDKFSTGKENLREIVENGSAWKSNTYSLRFFAFTWTSLTLEGTGSQAKSLQCPWDLITLFVLLLVLKKKCSLIAL